LYNRRMIAIKNTSFRNKPRVKRSPIWLMPLEEFKQLIANSRTYTDVLSYWGLKNEGGSFHRLKARIIADNIDDTHISSVNIGIKAWRQKGRTIEEYLVKDGPRIKGQELKRRLIKAGLKFDFCEECGQEPIWNNRTLVLQLDHINGDKTDNRIENLRILCPHCHSQTDTFAGKNCTHAKPKKVCPNCNTTFNSKLKHCTTCATWRTQPRPSRHKVPHPTAEELHTLIWSKPITQLAVDLGVSDVAIHKWCRQLGVEKPPRGYFQKLTPKVKFWYNRLLV